MIPLPWNRVAETTLHERGMVVMAKASKSSLFSKAHHSIRRADGGSVPAENGEAAAKAVQDLAPAYTAARQRGLDRDTALDDALAKTKPD